MVKVIKVTIVKNSNDDICAFEVKNHGKSIVCASVSMLVINTLNAIEVFTDEPMLYQADEDEMGYISAEFEDIKNGIHNEKVALLLDTMELGLLSTEKNYKKEITIKYKRLK